MIFGRQLHWYFVFVRTPFIAAAIVLVATELAGRVPFLVPFSLVASLPVAWLAKLLASLVVGYRLAQAEKQVLQSVAGGAILGMGIGVVSIGIDIFRFISFIRPKLFPVFGGLDIFFILGSEMISSAFFALVGGVLAGGRLERL